jgi:hypothetical protein
MTERVYVHVGPHKTGTTFLQEVLKNNKPALASNGVLFPGERYARQAEAVLDLLPGSKGLGKDPRPGRWKALVREVAEWPGDITVLSHEGISTAGSRSINRLVESLAPAEVHVVYTARDLTKVIPAMWQTRMRNQGSEVWASYLGAVRGDPGAKAPWGQRLWNAHDPREVFGRWEKQVPPEHIHVVTVPPSGGAPGVLWERFCSAIGIDPTPYSLEVQRRNESLGTAEVEVLRRINERVVARISDSSYTRWVKVFTARRVLEKRPEQTKFALPVEEQGWVRERAEEIIGFLEQGRYSVTGDLRDLLPATTPTAARPDEVDLEQALDAAVDVIAAIVVELDAGSEGGR